jgi:hypothetical protein
VGKGANVPKVFLMTAQATMTISRRSVRFFTHEETLAKKRPACCIRWDRETDTFLPTANPCPAGTHDQVGCAGEVVTADCDNFHKLSPPGGRHIYLIVGAYGPAARLIRDGEEGQLYVFSGYEAPVNHAGKWGRMLQVVTGEYTTREAIMSRLTIARKETLRYEKLMGDRAIERNR